MLHGRISYNLNWLLSYVYVTSFAIGVVTLRVCESSYDWHGGIQGQRLRVVLGMLNIRN